MGDSVKFYYDFVSPYSYLAFTQLPAVSHRTGATFDLTPIHILTVMDQVGNAPTTATCKAKAVYARSDLARWARHYHIPVRPHPKFGTFSTEALLLGALAAKESDQLSAFSKAAFEAVWLNRSDLETDIGIVRWLEEAGVKDASKIWAAREGFREQLLENHDAAVADGVFGVPSFKSTRSLFFGNDRLEFLEQELVA